MELPFEAAKGVSEKALGVKFPALMRVVLPGLLASAALYPSVAWSLRQLPPSLEGWVKLVAYAVLVVILGALISTLSNEVYKVYEGRIWWPKCLREWSCARQQERVNRLRWEADAALARSDRTRYNEIWYQLRSYPLDEHGQPQATYPTLLGNILAGYEEYPGNRYGMDSIFFWPRIWLQMEKETKEEIDSQWSVADGFLTLSVISLVGGVLWMGQALVASLGLASFAIPLQLPCWAALVGVAWLLLGYLCYRLSLPFHRENGEVYKSIFDLYRSTIWEMTSLRPQEKEVWKATWLYLQYLRFKCPNCGKSNSAASKQCEHCGFGLAEITQHWRSSGEFPR